MTTSTAPEAPATAGRLRRPAVVVAVVLAVVAVSGAGLAQGVASDRSWAADRCKATAMEADAALTATEPSRLQGDAPSTLEVRLEWTPLPTWMCDIGYPNGTTDTVNLGRRLNLL
jgi:hypothetical protein